MNFCEEKATAVASFYLNEAGGRPEDLKLMKLMYLAEREMIRRANVGISGDSFLSMQNGPVLSKTLRFMRGKPLHGAGEIWNLHIASPSQWILLLKNSMETDPLSVAEREVLAQQWQAHGGKDKWELVDLTHDFPEWDERAMRLRTSMPIPIVDVLEAFKLPNETIEARLAHMKAADYFCRLVNEAKTS